MQEIIIIIIIIIGFININTVVKTYIFHPTVMNVITTTDEESISHCPLFTILVCFNVSH